MVREHLISLFLFAYLHDEREEVIFLKDDDVGGKLIMLNVEVEFYGGLIELGSEMVFPLRCDSYYETEAVVDVEEGNNVGDGAFFVLSLFSPLFLNTHQNVC